MIVESYSEGDTLLHTLDPRIKIGLAFPYAFIIALSQKLTTTGFALLLAVILIVLAKLRFRIVAKSLKPLFFFIVLMWIFLPLSIPGIPVYTYGPLTMSREGVVRALSITIKSTSIVLIIISMLSTSTVFALMHALSHFRVPKKLLWLAFLSYRYIHVLWVEYLRLRDAMRIRGFKPRTNMHTYKTLGYLIGMLLIRSYERSERIYHAMLCRGFHGRFYLLDHFKIRTKDIAFMIVMFIPFFGIGWFEWIVTILS